jgi:hypothetical protein
MSFYDEMVKSVIKENNKEIYGYLTEFIELSHR